MNIIMSRAECNLDAMFLFGLKSIRSKIVSWFSLYNGFVIL